MRLLLAEDEKLLSKAIVKILNANNYTVDTVYNGTDALSYIRFGCYDAIILDIMMPEIDGIEVLKTIRAEQNNTPVLILSAKSEVNDRVLGLNSGANYYLTKPFYTKELLAAIRAITRSVQTVNNIVQYGNLSLNLSTYELSSPYDTFRLANKEFQILELLFNNPKCIISTEKFMDKIWGFDSSAEINIVWVYISYLRKKFQALNANVKITAHRNLGYSLEVIE